MSKKLINLHTTHLIQNRIQGINNFSLIQLPTNSGPSKARNIGAKNAKYDILAFIDADAYADIDRLRNISKAFTEDNIVACGGMIDNYNTDFFSNINHITEFSECMSLIVKKKNNHPSANIIYRKHILQELGGFDEKLRFGEDTELNFRLHTLGYSLYYIPNIIIRHDTTNNFFSFIHKMHIFGKHHMCAFQKNNTIHGQYPHNKYIFIIKFPYYIIGNVFIYQMKHQAFYKHIYFSLLGIPFLLLLRFVFWYGVGQTLFKKTL